jgi:hypothetical protein|tara:strand:+ start:193 stop:645 length:453 start_codon:yes stop_codon:yes gene_type:complete
MVTFRNNNNHQRRNNFRRSDRNFKSGGDRAKFGSNYSNNENFKRKVPGRNNHNAPKLIEKYNDLAREASSSGDKILSENYLQHADHFTRVMNEQDAMRKEKLAENKVTNDLKITEENPNKVNEISKDKIVEKIKDEAQVEKVAKSQSEVN